MGLFLVSLTVYVNAGMLKAVDFWWTIQYIPGKKEGNLLAEIYSLRNLNIFY
jgi:hypothetical protein